MCKYIVQDLAYGKSQRCQLPIIINVTLNQDFSTLALTFWTRKFFCWGAILCFGGCSQHPQPLLTRCQLHFMPNCHPKTSADSTQCPLEGETAPVENDCCKQSRLSPNVTNARLTAPCKSYKADRPTIDEGMGHPAITEQVPANMC